MATPAVDVALHLDAALANLNYGVNLFDGPIRRVIHDGGIPGLSVFCLADSGRPDTRFVDGDQKTALIKPTVTVWVRSGAYGYEDGETVARQIYEAIDKRPPPGYIEARVFNSYPTYDSEDEDGHHYWIVTVDLVAPHDILDQMKEQLYIGIDAPGQTGEAFIQSLVYQPLAYTRAVTFTVDAGDMAANNKIYYAAPDSLGTPTFEVNGFAGGFFLAQDNVLVGGTAYDLWESDNVGLGETTVTVK